MTATDTHLTSHAVAVRAPARTVYDIVSRAADWPHRFAPTVHVEHLERGVGSERFRIWATANGEVKTWTSRRELDPEQLRVAFRQEVSRPPVVAMGGEWVISPETRGECRVELRHDFRAVDDDPAGVEWINRAVDRNSGAELAAVKALAELGDRLGELEFTFADTVRVPGPASGAAVFDFLDRADLWPERLPHVSRLDLKEEEPGVQLMTMDTRTPDGTTHTTESVRICFGPDRIVYKQTAVPALMTAHTGSWSIVPAHDGVHVVSRHTVMINESAVERVLGAGRTVADARAYVQRALSTNSTTTLQHARAYAETRCG